MRKKELIMHASAEEVGKRLVHGEDKTDWNRVKAMSQAEIESLADDDDGVLPDGWESSVIMGLPPRKKEVHIRLDADIIDWFKGHGTGYQTRINAVLRSFVHTRQRIESNHSK